MAEANSISLCLYIVRTQGIAGTRIGSAQKACSAANRICLAPRHHGYVKLTRLSRCPPGLYRGMSMELFRGVLSGAVAMLVREQSEVIASRMLLGGGAIN